jgi:hypothetical protein
MTAQGVRVAVLVDADAIGADVMDDVIAAAAAEGTLVVVRAWRHWDAGQRKSWAAAAARHGVREGRQSPGRNATDIALAIDAIDLLHERAIDTFCIVSNDRDYEPLAARLRRSGRRVVLMTGAQGMVRGARSLWDRCVWLGKPGCAPAAEEASTATRGGEASARAYREAIARQPAKDDGWVRVTDLGPMVAKQQRVKLKWLRKHPGFVVDRRSFLGKAPDVDCVRLSDGGSSEAT